MEESNSEPGEILTHPNWQCLPQNSLFFSKFCLAQPEFAHSALTEAFAPYT